MKTFDFEKIPIVEIVNDILLDGVKKGASDIHFDPSKDKVTIRMRVDGVLYDYSVVPMDYKRNMISRVKMIASMNIMETRLPQDGAIKSKIGDKMLDLRVSSLPTNCGEKVVLRILDYSKSLQGLETLGFSEANLNRIIKMIEVPNGIVLVTGATGSGKSTTVYSILQRLNTREVNIITVEDPVEMDVEGINQVQAQAEIGLDFASVLRSILRQDPDIIMIGEIRDGETAKIAVRASITGHKVLSTIHTNSALNTIERLTDMEVERYLIGTSLNGIISQKLARKLCPHCKKSRPTTDYEKSLFTKVLKQDIDTIYDINPDGCEYCVKGFKNRIAIAEVLFITDEVRTGITNSLDKESMRKLVYGQSGTHTLLQDGLEKVALGETSFEEVLKLVDLENDLAIHEELEKEGLATGSNLEYEREAKAKKEAEIITKEKEEKEKQAMANPLGNPNGVESKIANNNVPSTPSVPLKPVGTAVAPAQTVTPAVNNINSDKAMEELIANNPEKTIVQTASAIAPISQTGQNVANTAQATPVQNTTTAPNTNNVITQKVNSDPFEAALSKVNTAPASTQANNKPKVELSAVIPPNNSQAAVNLNTNEVPMNLKMFEQ